MYDKPAYWRRKYRLVSTFHYLLCLRQGIGPRMAPSHRQAVTGMASTRRAFIGPLPYPFIQHIGHRHKKQTAPVMRRSELFDYKRYGQRNYYRHLYDADQASGSSIISSKFASAAIVTARFMLVSMIRHAARLHQTLSAPIPQSVISA